MAVWTTPTTHVVGDALAVSDWNAVCGNETFLYQKPYASATGAATNVNSGAFVQLALASSTFSGYGFSLASNAFVVPLAATYWAYANVAFNTGTATYIAVVALAQNGTKQAGPPTQSINAAQNIVVSTTSLFKCAASDSIAVQAYQNTGGAMGSVTVSESGMFFVGSQ